MLVVDVMYLFADAYLQRYLVELQVEKNVWQREPKLGARGM